MSLRRRITLVLTVLVLLLFTVGGCAGKKKEAVIKAPVTPEEMLNEKVVEFYDFMLYKKLTNYHNALAIEKRFVTQEKFYDFLDTFFPLMRDRNILRSTFHSYYIKSITVEEGGEAALVDMVFYSKDVIFLKRKMEVKHEWEKVYGTWYPHKVIGRKLGRYERPFKLYTLRGL